MHFKIMRTITFIILGISFFTVCTKQQQSKVEISKTATGYQLLRNGHPYYIRGAGIEDHYDILAESGGNSIRTWGTNQWDEAFEQAEKFGLTVCAGMWLEQERQGFNYSDSFAVQRQFEHLKESIIKYKDHPALLMWGIGNELDLSYKNKKVWDAVEQLAKFIHQVDGNHPTMTTTAFIEQEEVELIKSQAPHIDILSVNAYAGLPVLSDFLQNFGWDKPYVLGEWGTHGHWEVAKTTWNEPIEFNSSEKASLYRDEYKHITNAPNCLGGYVFFWGAKQERTPTWYGIFSEDGKKTETVDVMYNLWKQSWPENRAPLLDSLRINGLSAYSSVHVKVNAVNEAKVWLRDPENDSLTVKWEILHETTDKQSGGDEEQKPSVVEGWIFKQSGTSLQFNAPQGEGAYRLFVYAYDQNGNVAHANIPFYLIAEKEN